MAAGAPEVAARPGESDAAAALRILSAGSKSFSLAGRLMRPATREAAAAVYAFCRRCDDQIDDAPHGEQPARLALLRSEIDALYAADGPIATGRWSTPQPELALRAFAQVARERGIPRAYPDELVNGMEMDVHATRYEELDELLLYCYRVASVVGLMMCHVMGVKDDRALRPAAHLGIALQLTNISRDVLEDWHMGRLYVPASLLGAAAADLHARLDAAGAHADPGPLPDHARAAMAAAVQRLLDRADSYYASAEAGLADLPFSSALAIRAARWIYWAIGDEVAQRGYDVWPGRAVVSTRRKVALLGGAVGLELLRIPTRLTRRRGGRPPGAAIREPSEVLPW